MMQSAINVDENGCHTQGKNTVQQEVVYLNTCGPAGLQPVNQIFETP